MEQMGEELFGEAFNEWPILLRPVWAAIIFVIEGFKLFYYFLLPTAATILIMLLAVAVLANSVGFLVRARRLDRDEDETKRKRDDNTRRSVQHRLEAGELK